MTTSNRSDPKNVVFLIAAIHALIVSAPSLILSITKNTDKDLVLPLLSLDDKDLALLSKPGLTKDIMQLVGLLISLFSIGYYRIYVDGAANQPLMVFLGGIGKLASVGIMASSYYNMQENRDMGLVLVGMIPDATLGLYYVKVWIEMGAVFSANKVKKD